MSNRAESHQLAYDDSVMDLSAPRLDRAVARIVEAMRPEAIYLFGSHARGEATADSDYDLLVVVADNAPAETRSLDATTKVARDPGVALDIVPCRRSVFERKRHHVGTLSYLATHEGRLIYGR
ncbi:nucleotidyltransferase domain-containing protein [soil metagenome]